MGQKSTLVDTYLRARLLGMVLVNVSLALLLVFLYLGLLVLLAQFGVQDHATLHMLASVGLAVAVVPLRRRLVMISNHLLRLRWQDSEEILREFSTALSHTIEPDALRALLIDDLPGRLRCRVDCACTVQRSGCSNRQMTMCLLRLVRRNIFPVQPCWCRERA